MSCAIVLNPEPAQFFMRVFSDFVVMTDEDGAVYAYIPGDGIGFNANGDVVVTLPAGKGKLHVPHRLVAAIWEAGSSKGFPGFFRSPTETADG